MFVLKRDMPALRFFQPMTRTNKAWKITGQHLWTAWYRGLLQPVYDLSRYFRRHRRVEGIKHIYRSNSFFISYRYRIRCIWCARVKHRRKRVHAMYGVTEIAVLMVYWSSFVDEKHSARTCFELNNPCRLCIPSTKFLYSIKYHQLRPQERKNQSWNHQTTQVHWHSNRCTQTFTAMAATSSSCLYWICIKTLRTAMRPFIENACRLYKFERLPPSLKKPKMLYL